LICKFGADVEVVSPRSLRERVAGDLKRAAVRYG
jgi:predicted DNA-binding transcriptional regulator YafY